MIEGYKNYEWYLKNDLSQYAGEWVAILDKKVIAHDKNLNKIISNIRNKYINKKPLITKVKNKISIV